MIYDQRIVVSIMIEHSHLDSQPQLDIMWRPAHWAGRIVQDFRSGSMPPLPKRKISKGRRDRRRTHDSLKSPHLVVCTNCGEKHLPHYVCPNCGHYAGREIIEIER